MFMKSGFTLSEDDTLALACLFDSLSDWRWEYGPDEDLRPHGMVMEASYR